MENSALEAIFSPTGLYHLFRWIHFMAGIVWIGLLYYFNFVQGPFMAEADAATKSAAQRLLFPKALAWFRWGALVTWLSGLVMLHLYAQGTGHSVYTTTSWGLWILTGTILGTLMAYNVWFVIWPNQKIVIASAQAVASGQPANPAAAGAGGRALVASRTNALFSMPMLFCMGAASHLPFAVTETSSVGRMFAILSVVLALLEFNALKGKVGPMASIKGVIHLGLVFTVVIYLIVTLGS